MNKFNKKLVLGIGTFLGQGGPGSFINLVNTAVGPMKAQYSWRYIRLTGHKKDIAELANGYMVLNRDGMPLSANHKPTMRCLSDIEAELGNNVTVWGHAVTRGGTKVTITPSPSPITWAPAKPAVGGGGSGEGSRSHTFSSSALGQYVRSHEDVSGAPPSAPGWFDLFSK